MAETSVATGTGELKAAVQAVLNSIEREREREIITRRFGLFERRETLEQIGELLGITRERVRQLEKAILARLEAQAPKVDSLSRAESVLTGIIEGFGGAARTRHIAAVLKADAGEREHAHIAFVATLAPGLETIEENDHFHHGIVLSRVGAKSAKQHVEDLSEIIRKHGKPLTIDALHRKSGHNSTAYVGSIASLSKHLSNLRDQWGLSKWPTVNPKNIRDKIYVILRERRQPMHFSEIAEAIKDSDFKRKDVTVQAIHNELIKDKRFVLIGRGIYALGEWGYSKGTVADIIGEVLRENGEPLHRDDIIRRVLEKRQVKETTILLNLQSKPQFRRVAKATYALTD
jgi:hypothetical protein